MTNKQSLGELATAAHKEGYNCAESILRVFRTELNLPLHEETLTIATGFGGGLGQAGCLCGALSGAIMVISLLQGRTDAKQSKDPAYANVKEFHTLFVQKFSASCCRALKAHAFGTTEQRHNCLQIVAATADLLYQFLLDKKLTHR